MTYAIHPQKSTIGRPSVNGNAFIVAIEGSVAIASLLERISTVITMSSFEAEPIFPRIATRVTANRQTLLDGTHAAELRTLLGSRSVLVFPKFHCTDGELETFSATLGELGVFGNENILKLGFGEKGQKEAGDDTEYVRGTFAWHVDRTTEAVPNHASVLTARRISAFGGETEFANTSAAYQDLPEGQKRHLETLRVLHSIEHLMLAVQPDAPEEERAHWRAFGQHWQPLVWTDSSGRKSLMIGATAGRIEGMGEVEGRALLDELLAWATRPEYVYRHRWRLGDVVVWDNTGAMHRACPYPEDSGRLMHRVTVMGEAA